MPENPTLDFKRVSAKHSRLYETLCAFANTDGGLLALGVGDAKAMRPGDKPASRLFGIEETPEGFDDLRRDLLTRFTPPLGDLHWLRLPCALANGQPGHLVLLRVEKSAQVHSIVGNGTWARMDASNRQMTAAEITDLAYQRGVKSAETLLMPMTLDLLNTSAWRSYCATRGLADTDLAQRLPRLGLALADADRLQPLLAAVLLFAEEPGALLAAQGMRADMRVFHYHGKAVLHGDVTQPAAATQNHQRPRGGTDCQGPRLCAGAAGCGTDYARLGLQDQLPLPRICTSRCTASRRMPSFPRYW